MPTIQSMDIPLPQNWQEFENIVRDALANHWQSPSLQKNGRPGQNQSGVDIYGPDYLGRLVGIQCKKYKSQLKIKTVTDEIENAENFTGQLSTLYIATTAEHDSLLQAQVRIISEKRARQGKFAVGVIFWDEVVAGLVINPATLRAHYPNLSVAPTTEVNRERQLGALEYGYYGADLWEYITLMYGEFGWMAQVDTDELIANLRVLEYRSQQLLEPKDSAPIIQALSLIRDGCLSTKTNDSDWNAIELQAKRVSKRISKSSSLISISEGNVVDLGVQLGKIYHNSDEIPTADILESIKNKVTHILGSPSNNEVDRVFTDAKKVKSGYRWAMRVYNFVDRELRYR
jgi:hypothetical protein